MSKNYTIEQVDSKLSKDGKFIDVKYTVILKIPVQFKINTPSFWRSIFPALRSPITFQLYCLYLIILFQIVTVVFQLLTLFY